MFKPGSIRKIEVKNFVTYNYAEMFPGPNLNMIIGPNGTGKSTMVAAIILGLGGNPKTVGRGSRVSEYVKHNCSDSTINVFLQGETENSFIKITRSFNTDDKNTWHLNNAKVLFKDVVNYVQKYNIQVNNLCQFLPQDRVQDFAKLNQQELLKETQLALCREDLIEKQKTLIESRENHNKIQSDIEKNCEKLEVVREANMRLEGRVKNFQKKREYLNTIQDIDRKIAWMDFEKVHEKLTDTKNDLTKATQVYENYRSSAKPLEKKIDEAKKVVVDLQQKNANIIRTIKQTETSLRMDMEKMDSYKQLINNVKSEMNSKIAQIDRRNDEIEATSTKVEEMKLAQKELITKYGNDQEVQGKLSRISNEVQKFNNHIRGLEDKKEEIVQNKQSKIAQLRSFRNEVERLENVKQQRLKYLERVDRDAFQAVLWLRNNRHLFKGEVFEPIMLEVNVLDARNCVYVENVIPIRDRLAFTCVEKDDMNQLIRHLRDEKKLTVNVLHSGKGENLSSFRPIIPIEHLRRFGLYTYLHSLFTAPEPIMRYLCKTYRIHNIPVGNYETNKFFEDVPKEIRVFFSDKQKYSVGLSRYTNEKSIRQNEISSDGGLSISIDIVRLDNLREQIQETESAIEGAAGHVAEFNNQISLIGDKVAKLRDEVKYIRNVKLQIESIENRVIQMENKIREMRQTPTNREAIKLQAQQKITKIIKDINQLQVNLKNCFKNYANLVKKNAITQLKIEQSRTRVAYLENNINDIRQRWEEAERTLNQIRVIYANIKGQAKVVLQKAKGLSKGFTPDDDGFDEFRAIHNSLSTDLQELQTIKNELLSKIECLSTADDQELQEYEERLKTIENLQETNEKAHINLSKITKAISQLEQDWLNPLKEIIAEINNKFATAYERMGCAGEVSLDVGKDEKEYAQYGLSVKVTYRNGEPLQQLNKFIQSGGERAVATAAFMLSLQELTPVPFRCVDEINQGMDSNNERRIFDLLVESTSQSDTSQYFLITPKLVPNLKFCETMMVHVIHNGPFVDQDKKWGCSMVCNPQGVQIH